MNQDHKQINDHYDDNRYSCNNNDDHHYCYHYRWLYRYIHLDIVKHRCPDFDELLLGGVSVVAVDLRLICMIATLDQSQNNNQSLEHQQQQHRHT